MDGTREGEGLHNGSASRQKISFLNRFFRSVPPPSLDMVNRNLWVASSEWSDQKAAYQVAVLEQYKLYAEMADRVSARRAQANTLFLTLNTSIFTAFGIFWQSPPSIHRGLLLVPWLVLVAQCMGWFWLLRSYRQLNTAKYVVLGAIEQRLPASPYWSAEWVALGEGRDPARYVPMSYLEQWIPLFFACAYTVGFLLLSLS
ncbi:RipA family octameric membrane protein [Streptomyces sediminimaris]|uniref:RipA family octameric membrane protein n=1 Tax=Streptomyces sediminimaris TaxID=3383721 RepID=UPI00399AF40E